MPYKATRLSDRVLVLVLCATVTLVTPAYVVPFSVGRWGQQHFYTAQRKLL